MTSRNGLDDFIDIEHVEDHFRDSARAASTPLNEPASSSGNPAPSRQRPQVVIEETQTHQDADQAEAMVTLANTMAGLLQQFTSQVTKMNRRREKPAQTFSGLVHENPAAFVQYIESYFTNNSIHEDHQKIDIFKGQLKDAAKKWVQAFEGIPLSYQALQESFLRRYNSVADKSTAISVLYGEKQKTDERVELFINKKRSLFARLNPNVDEGVMAQILVDQLLPPVRSRLRGHMFTDIAELLHLASKAESDVEEEAKYWRQIYAPKPVANVTGNTRRTEPPTHGKPAKPATPCRFCQGWHFHKDCPRNPYNKHQPLNYTRAPDSRGDNRTPASSAAPNAAPRRPPTPAGTPGPRPRPNTIQTVAQVHRDADAQITTTSASSPSTH